MPLITDSSGGTQQPSLSDAEKKAALAETIKLKREQSQPLLQAMAHYADAGKVNAYFTTYNELLNLWQDKDSDPEGAGIPPWYIPGMDIQMVIIHTQLALLTRVLNESQVFAAAFAAQKARNSSGLVGPGGAPLGG